MTLERKEELKRSKKILEDQIKIYKDELEKMMRINTIINKLIEKIGNIDDLYNVFIENKQQWERFKDQSLISKQIYKKYTHKYNVTRFNRFRDHSLTNYAHEINQKSLSSRIKNNKYTI